ncbi:MAG: GHKL domain-containing protein [Clostridiales bacterium]|nr:GHKL domain-containing protein [Clostridiales bacterium]
MFDITVLFSSYKIQFALELMAALAIVTGALKRRSRFGWRVLLGALGVLAVATLLPVLWSDAAYMSLLFLVIFASSLVALHFCFQESTENIVFCGVLAYTTQHLAYQTYNFLMTISGLSKYGDMYRESAFNDATPLTLLLYAVSYVLIYWGIWVLVSYLIYSEENLDIGGFSARLGLSFVIVLVDVVLNAVLVFHVDADTTLPLVVEVVVYAQSMLCCALAMAIQFTLLQKESAVHEAAEIRRLWQLDRAMYERFRESTELINIKCHDLKHQIQTLRQTGGSLNHAALDELEREISVYSRKIETGNQILDTILDEQNMQCEYEHITFICIAAGSELGFLSTESLCSLFGNAISNAIEAVKKVDDLEKRVIYLTVSRQRDMIFIHVENYCVDAHQLVFKNGLPQTTKEDKECHGYGMRSMQLMAEKLGGGLDAHIQEDMFHLNIFLPVTEML